MPKMKCRCGGVVSMSVKDYEALKAKGVNVLKTCYACRTKSSKEKEVVKKEVKEEKKKLFGGDGYEVKK